MKKKLMIVGGKFFIPCPEYRFSAQQVGNEIKLTAKATFEVVMTSKIIKIVEKIVDIIMVDEEPQDVTSYEILTEAGLFEKSELSEREEEFCRIAEKNGNYRYDIQTMESLYFAELPQIFDAVVVKYDDYNIIRVDKFLHTGKLTRWEIEQYNKEGGKQHIFANLEEAKVYLSGIEPKYTVVYDEYLLEK